jgi:hypothetical protein
MQERIVGWFLYRPTGSRLLVCSVGDVSRNRDACGEGWTRSTSKQKFSPGFAPRPVHVGFVVDKVALGQVFLRVLRFSPVNTIQPLLHIHSCIIWELVSGPVSGRSSSET